MNVLVEKKPNKDMGGDDLSLPDEQIIDEIRNGSHAKLDILYKRYYQKVVNKCMEFTKNKDEAHDLAQDIFLKTFDHLYSFQGKSKFSTWLYSITCNHCIEYFRKKNRNSFVDLENAYHIHEEDEFDDHLADYAFMDQIINSMANISDVEKEMLVMKYQQNHSIKELQQKFNLSASATKMRLKRAKSKLLSYYKELSYKT